MKEKLLSNNDSSESSNMELRNKFDSNWTNIVKEIRSFNEYKKPEEFNSARSDEIADRYIESSIKSRVMDFVELTLSNHGYRVLLSENLSPLCNSLDEVNLVSSITSCGISSGKIPVLADIIINGI